MSFIGEEGAKETQKLVYSSIYIEKLVGLAATGNFFLRVRKLYYEHCSPLFFYYERFVPRTFRFKYSYVNYFICEISFLTRFKL